MKNYILLFALMFVFTISKAQVPLQFSGLDCNGNVADLYADLDAGKAVILHFYMPSCGSCPPPAQKIQAMAQKINATYPGKVKGYAFPYQNSTTCTYSANWVSSNNLGVLYQPMDSGATHVAHYGGFGMPTVVLLGGSDANKRVMFSTLSFVNSDTTKMRDSILAMLSSTTNIQSKSQNLFDCQIFPNPAKDLMTIQLNLTENSDVTVEILDLSGKRISLITEEKHIQLIDKQYNISDIPNGYYLVHVFVNGQNFYQKLSINH